MIEEFVKEIYLKPSELANYMALADYLQDINHPFGGFLSKTITKQEAAGFITDDFIPDIQLRPTSMLISTLRTTNTQTAYFFDGKNWFKNTFSITTHNILICGRFSIQIKSLNQTNEYKKQLFNAATLLLNSAEIGFEDSFIPIILGALWASKYARTNPQRDS